MEKQILFNFAILTSDKSSLSKDIIRPDGDVIRYHTMQEIAGKIVDIDPDKSIVTLLDNKGKDFFAACRFPPEAKTLIKESIGKDLSINISSTENGNEHLSLKIDGDSKIENDLKGVSKTSLFNQMMTIHYKPRFSTFKLYNFNPEKKEIVFEKNVKGETKRYVFNSQEPLDSNNLRSLLDKQVESFEDGQGGIILSENKKDLMEKIREKSTTEKKYSNLLMENHVLTERNDLEPVLTEDQSGDHAGVLCNIPVTQISGKVESLSDDGKKISMSDKDGKKFSVSINQGLLKKDMNGDIKNKKVLTPFIGKNISIKLDGDSLKIHVENGPTLSVGFQRNTPPEHLLEKKELKYGDAPVDGELINLYDKFVEIKDENEKSVLIYADNGFSSQKNIDSLRGQHVTFSPGFDGSTRIALKGHAEEFKNIIMPNDGFDYGDKRGYIRPEQQG